MSERPTISPRLQVGDIAPDITLTQTTGEHITLTELRQQGRVLLVFLRHFG